MDDGRKILEKLRPEVKFCESEKRFLFKKEWLSEAQESIVTAEMRTEIEIRNSVKSISPDLVFTTETE